MSACNPSRKNNRRSPSRASLTWAAISALALVAFMVEIEAGAPPSAQDATRVVPALK